MNSVQTRPGIALNCRWNLKDAAKVFLAYVILLLIGMPVIVRFVNALLGFNILNSIGHRNLVLFISVFINMLVCSYVFYIVCIEYRQSVTALGLSLENLSGNIKQGVKRYAITLPVIILAGFVVNLISSYYGQAPQMQEIVQWVLEEKSVFILGSLIFLGLSLPRLWKKLCFAGFCSRH